MTTAEIIAISVSLLVMIFLVALTFITKLAIKKRLEENKHLDKRFDDLDLQIREVKLDQLRTNLMLLMEDYPDNSGIPLLARQYVVDYKGDSYMIELLMNWYLEKAHLSIPDWLNSAYMNHTHNIEV